MTLEECKVYLKYLEWNTPETVKTEAKEKLKHMDNDQLPMLLFPHGKSCWDGAAEVITEIGLPRIHGIMPGVMEWLQDMNWPGAKIIFDYLEKQSKETMLPHIQQALHKANEQNDQMWLYWMMYLMENMQIRGEDFQDIETCTIFIKVKEYYLRE